ncbi:MAG: hypothetical protein Q8K75_09635 [Chlamydiales bacterium]|nr:hypothetical protein [Chlamydiales bacterium]
MLITIPSCDSASIIGDSFRSVGAWPVMVVDNASEDGSVALARELLPQAQIITRAQRLSRVSSWQSVIDNFLTSNANWMKWLFAGDTLFAPAVHDIQNAIEAYPEARLVVCNYIAVEEAKRWQWRPPALTGTKLLHPQESMLMVAKYANWFGPPLAHCIHREALSEVTIPDGFSWCADGAFCLAIASRYPVLYLDVNVGEFHVSKRRYFSAREGSPEAIFEESLLRLRALEFLQEHDSHADLMSSIQFDAFKRLVKRGELNVAGHIFDKAKRLIGGK